MESVPIPVADGPALTVRIHRAAVADAPIVVVLPGLGVAPQYYDGLGAELVAAGFHAATCELRGESYGYQDLVAVDLPAMFAVIRERFGSNRGQAGGRSGSSSVYVLGHSLGGHLAVMYAARIRGRLSGLILVASGSPYHVGYGLRSPALFLGSMALSMTSAVVGHWPGDRLDIGGFGKQSRALVSDWSSFARTGRIDPAGSDIDYEERIGRLTFPVLSITVEGDTIVPARSSKNLVDKMQHATVTYGHEPKALGHNGWIADPRGVVDQVSRWMP